MFEILFSRPSAIRRHVNAPFSAEREVYLRRLADRGSPLGVVRRAAYICHWVAERIRRWPHDQPLQDEDIAMLAMSWARRRATNRRRAVPLPSPKESFRSVAKGFLREAGMLASEPIPPVGSYEDRIQAFLGEQHEASGLAPATCSFRGKQTRRFMIHLEEKGIRLENLRPLHLDDYFHRLATSWCRVSLRLAAVLRGEGLGVCGTRQGDSGATDLQTRGATSWAHMGTGFSRPGPDRRWEARPASSTCGSAPPGGLRHAFR